MNLPLMVAGALLATSFTLGADEPVKPVRKTAFDVSETISIGGTVIAVTKDSVLLSPDKKALTTYPAHDCLASGKVHKMVSAGRSYRLSDVQAGDFVWLDTIVENKQTFCVAIQIWERPGGLVPPGQVLEKGEKTYHTVRNADIAFRDKGTPIPEHLKPKFPDELPKAQLKK